MSSRRSLRSESGTAAFVAALIALVGFTGLAKPGNPSMVGDTALNVLLITLDTTRSDRLGCYGYSQAETPNLDALAGSGTRFVNAYAPVPLTLPSHCSLLTGTYPYFHGVHNNGDTSSVLSPDRLTLAEILKAQGYKTAAIVASFSVDSRFGLNQGFDLYDDEFREGMVAERRAEEVSSVFSEWLAGVRDERFFCWIHFFDPHLPYAPPQPYRDRFAERPYDGEVAYMDSRIGEVLGALKDRNLIKRTLVVAAGDHGEAFGEKGESGHGVFLYDMALKVPLIFSSEDALPRGAVITSRVRLIDVLPTILEVLNLPVPGDVQGKSLIPFIRKRESGDLDSYLETYYPLENYGWAPFLGVVSGKWKYLRAPRSELYDLTANPGETKNLLSSERKIAANLGNRLDGFLKEARKSTSSRSRALTAEEKDKLRSLGYVDHAEKTIPANAPDPKDRLDELKIMQEAERLELEGRFEEAVGLCEKILALRPAFASSYENLALAQTRLRKFDAAVATLLTGLKKLPNSETLLVRLGHTYLASGRMNEALAAMGDVLKIEPRHPDALQASALILETLGRRSEAKAVFERALEVDPGNKPLRMAYARNLGALGKFPEAIEAYRSLIHDYPRDAMPYQMLGVLYTMSKDLDKAIENLSEAIRRKPTPPAYYHLGISFLEKGDFAGAVQNLERYLEDPRGEPEQRIRYARSTLDKLRKIKSTRRE